MVITFILNWRSFNLNVHIMPYSYSVCVKFIGVCLCVETKFSDEQKQILSASPPCIYNLPPIDTQWQHWVCTDRATAGCLHCEVWRIDRWQDASMGTEIYHRTSDIIIMRDFYYDHTVPTLYCICGISNWKPFHNFLAYFFVIFISFDPIFLAKLLTSHYLLPLIRSFLYKV